ncbi:MAG: hypothetical protein H6740_13500 [Alphaproteobacteria bacterium]|nr:hypothetical protein [Alphaproteobacteria bacterium]
MGSLTARRYTLAVRDPISLLIGAVLAVALAAAALPFADGPALLAWPGGEVWGHAWVQWWHGEALPAWPSGTALAVGADPWPVMDPLPTALAGVVGRTLGYVAGWNLVLLIGVLLAFLGGAALARAQGGEPLVGGAVLATGPALLGSMASGLTEDAWAGLLALSFAALTGTGLASAALGGLLLGLSAWCGLYLAWFGAGVAVCLGLGALWRGWREGALATALRRWGLAAALAVLMAAPALAPHLERAGDASAHRSGVTVEQSEPLWQLNPWRGADLASFWAPGAPTLEGDEQLRLHPVYLGWLALGLALFAGRSPWWGLLLLSGAMAAGRRLRWAGEPLGMDNPVALFVGDTLPFAELINHHARWMLVGEIALAVLAARGAARVIHRVIHTPPPDQNPICKPTMIHRVAAAAIALGISLEISLLSPAPLPLPLADAAVPEVWAAARGGEGALLPVPAGGPGVHFQRPLFDQRAHGRPLAISPNRPGPGPRAGAHPLGRWLGGVGLPQAPRPPASLSLEGLPFGGIVVQDAHVAEVEAVLGPPTVRAEGGAYWALTPEERAP